MRDERDDLPAAGGAAAKRHRRGRRRLVIVCVILCLELLLAGAYFIFEHYYDMMNIRDGKLFVGVETALRSAEEEWARFLDEGEKAGEGDLSDEAIHFLQSDIFSGLQKTDDIPYNNDVFNVLLLGTDTRGDTLNERTDSMILVSINRAEKRIVLSSFLRDIYLYIPDYGYQRLNVANVAGGPERTMETIEQNFGLNLDNYAFVNFYSFAECVDILGGVDVALNTDAIYFLNQHLSDPEVLPGVTAGKEPLPFVDGTYHLTGPQTLAYCRIRYLDSDFGRADRQRYVLTQLWEQSKGLSLKQLNALMEAILPAVTTDLTERQCLSLMATVADLASYEIVSQHIPADTTYYGAQINGASVIGMDFDANRELLQESIYGK